MARLTLMLVLVSMIAKAQTPPVPVKGHRIVVIGCVKRSAPDAAASGGTAVPAPDQTRYVLANVTLAADTSQTQTAEQLAAAVPLYRLADSAEGLIAPHVGEKVEVSGTIVPRAPTSSSPPPSSGTTPNQTSAPVLQVETLRSISKASPSCQ
jgi:hypothetical protein